MGVARNFPSNLGYVLVRNIQSNGVVVHHEGGGLGRGWRHIPVRYRERCGRAVGEYARIVSHPLHFGFVCCDDCALHSEKLYPECAGFSPRARLVCSRVLFRRELWRGVWTYEH